MKARIILLNLFGEVIKGKKIEFLHRIAGNGEVIEKNIEHPIIVGKTRFWVFSLSLTHKTHIATDRMNTYVVKLVDAKDEEDEQLKIVKFFDQRLGNKFKMRIVGDFDRPLEELGEDEDRYVQIVEVKDESRCYVDWLYDEFDFRQLEEYVRIEEERAEFGGGIRKIENTSVQAEYEELFKLLKIAIMQWKK